MTEGAPEEEDQALREALRTTWKTSEKELEALVPRPKEGITTIRRMQAVLLIVVKPSRISVKIKVFELIIWFHVFQKFFRRYKEMKRRESENRDKNMIEHERNVIVI